MRKKIALFLCMTLMISLLGPSSLPQASETGRAAEVINALSIMNTDQGNADAAAPVVTRAQFAQMMVNLSTLKEDVTSESNVSIFSDVKKYYWAAGYIQTAVNQGWMSGYLNGSFKPDQGITLQEAVYAIVKLLGYSNSDFYGNKVSAIMNLYKTKGLDQNISRKRTDLLTGQDCINLFYNTLNATTKDNKVYASVLGYSLDSNGELDYLALINTGVEGPVLVDSDWKSELPFNILSAAIYKNGTKCPLSEVEDYDVVYYSEYFKTVWVYDNKVSGTVEAINPDYTAPTSVTVDKKAYSFTDSSVTYRFTAMGDVKEGDVVTLLLGKDGKIVDVLGIDEYNVTMSGVALSVGTQLVESNNTYRNADCVTFVDASGAEHVQEYDPDTLFLEKGSLVSVTYVDGKAAVSSYTLAAPDFGNYIISSDATTLGMVKFASNVKILDLNNNEYISITPDRLAGVSLGSSSILYYALNDNGEISELILNDVTGDMDSYGVFTGITMSGNSTYYNYLIGSKAGSKVLAGFADLSYVEGPKGFLMSNNALIKSYDLTEVNVTALGSTTLQSGNVKYPYANDYTVYLKLNGEFITAALDRISDLSEYNVKAYIDNAVSAGGRIRIIVAESKSN